ncbi:MAG: hypothetical protein AABY88_00700 [Pseudomonadota bacterium]
MKRDYPAWVIIVIVLALVLPAASAYPQTIAMMMCSGEARTIRLNQDPSEPDHDKGRGCCKKACHAANDRRKRGSSAMLSCC